VSFPKPHPHRALKRPAAQVTLEARARIRRQVIARDQCRCVVCRGPVSYEGAHVHEAVFRSQGGNPVDPTGAGMVTLCPSCHQLVHHRVIRITLTPEGAVEVTPWTDKTSR